MNIAIFDYYVDDSNAIGKFHKLIVEKLCHEHNITVFSVSFDNPNPGLIRWVKVSTIMRRPLCYLFAIFRIVAPIRYSLYCKTHRQKFDLIQSVESNLGLQGLVFSHFCHRFFLKNHWKKSNAGNHNIRTFLRWLDHRMRAFFEPSAYRRVDLIVAGSHGLRRELEESYPVTSGKIIVIPSPIEICRMQKPTNFDRNFFRQSLEVRKGEILLYFAALGHFERKGLPLLLEAMRFLNNPKLKLIVLGGDTGVIKRYQAKTIQLRLSENVNYLGHQADVRPFLWASDTFILPSYYEVFPTVALEASAAGLPLLCTSLNGVEEYLVDGQNGICLERSVEGIAEGICRFLQLSDQQRVEMGMRAQESVKEYSPENFILRWKVIYDDIEKS